MPPKVATELGVSHLVAGLKRRSVRGAAVTLTGQSFRFGLQLVGGAILARLLSPRDFGLVGMVSAVTGVLAVFGDFGLSGATVQREEVDDQQISTLFWLNSALGCGLALLTAAVAPILAWLYGDLRLVPVAAALGLGFALSGVGVQHHALLQRQMRFHALVLIDAVSMVVSVAVGLSCASLRFGYWSLVWMQLAAGAASTAGVWLACSWKPRRTFNWKSTSAMMAFGGNLTAFTALNYLARNMDNVLIGRRWGAAMLGQYAKAYGLLLLPITQINFPVTSVAVPALSRLSDDRDRYRGYYLRALTLIAYLTVPLIVGLGVFAREVVQILLGPQWTDAASLFRILAVAGVLQPMANTAGWLYISLDRTAAMKRWGFISVFFCILSFLVGLPWGATGVATAYTICSCVLVWPCFVFAVRDTPISLQDVGGAIYRPLGLGLGVGVALLASKHWLTADGPVVSILGSSAIAVLTILLIRQLVSSVRADLARIVETVGMLRG